MLELAICGITVGALVLNNRMRNATSKPQADCRITGNQNGDCVALPTPVDVFSLDQRIDELTENAVFQLQKENADLRNEIDDMQSDFSDLQEELERLEKENLSLKSQLKHAQRRDRKPENGKPQNGKPQTGKPQTYSLRK